VVAVGSRRVDMRVSTLPTQFGEKSRYAAARGECAAAQLCRFGFPRDIAIEFRKSLIAAGNATGYGAHRLGKSSFALLVSQSVA